jgi:hypothetical protein
MGGSSITQQLAKNLFWGPRSNLIWKIREMLITYRLERELTKERILEIYLNVIEWGPGIYGVEAAAKAYFNKTASELSLSESIRLASVIPNPHSFSPLDIESKYIKERYEAIASGLLRRGWISRTTYERVLEELYRLQASKAIEPLVVPPPKAPPELLHPEYWVSKIPEPDRVIMTESEIESFNRRALIMSGGIDIFGLPDFLSGKEVRDKILEVAGLSPPFSFPLRYDSNNNPLTEHFYHNLIDNLNLIGIPDGVRTGYAQVIKNRTDVLAWPVDELIMSKPYDYEFNALQQSAIYIGTPVVVLHTSKDGNWVFIRTGNFDGWVKKEDLAWTTRKEALSYPGPRSLVVTAPLARTALGRELQMGVQVPIVKASSKGYEVKIPSRGSDGELVFIDDFLNPDGVRVGFLPYTKRNVITQAFKLIDGPYSWGGNKSGWDCSLFIQDVFRVFGIRLPRNSWWQVRVGKEIATFNKNNITRDKPDTTHLWEPGVTLLEMPGHIMLYLGKKDGKPYAIHALWGVSDKDGRIIKFNRVAVTDLEIGQGGEKGSLLERITNVRGVYLDPSGPLVIFKDALKWLSSHPVRLVSGFIFIIIAICVLTFGVLIICRLAEKRNGKKPK